MFETDLITTNVVDVECGAVEDTTAQPVDDQEAREREQAIIKERLNELYREDLYQKIEQNLISVNDNIPPLVPVIRRNGVLICSEGNISAVVGEAKSKKTFLCTALVGSMLDVCRQKLFGIEIRKSRVLWVDTEQSREHIQKVLFRINMMSKLYYNLYDKRILTLALREESPNDRLLQLRYAIEYHQPKLVVIDGVSDLMNNTNNLEESEALVSLLLQLSSIYGCHIMNVLHTNPSSDKARGHLGSTLMRKAETVLFVHKAGELSIVEPQYCRNMPFDRFAFTVEEIPDAELHGEPCVGLGIPVECEVPNEQSGREDECVRILRDELGGCAERKLLNSKVAQKLGITDVGARVKVHRALSRGVLRQDSNGVVTIAQ